MDYTVKITQQLRLHLQSLRKCRSVTQAQLGEAIGVTQARIVEIKANPGVVNLQQIMEILHTLGVDLVLRDTVAERAKAGADVGEGANTPQSSPNQGRW